MNTSTWRMVLSLGGIAALLGALLAAVHILTAEPIARAAMNQRKEAMTSMLGATDNDPLQQAVQVRVDSLGREFTVYPAVRDGHNAGAAVVTSTDKGFSGTIELMVAFDATGTLSGFRVLAHQETPGLGARMEQWFGAASGHTVVGSQGPLVLTADGGDVDGITAATITSRAFVGAVNDARAAFTSYLNQHTPLQ